MNCEPLNPINHETREKHEMKTRTEKRGFTLIELLVVIVIIGVLFAVALPVFENAGRKDTDKAAFQVMSTLRLARQNAIAKRQWTMVIFPHTAGGGYADEDLKKCLRGYAVIAATNNLDGVFRFSPTLRDPRISDMKLTFVSDWKYLPEGIYFDEDESLNANWVFGSNDSNTDTFRFPIDPANPNNLVRPMGVVLFKPNGRAYTLYDSSADGKFWRDAEAPWLKQICSIYLTSEKFYEESGGTLTGPTEIPGTNTVIHVRNKTGQVNIFDGIWE